jgi:type I restriction enzyme R subunit
MARSYKHSPASESPFGDFLAQRKPTGDQIEFINMIVDHLTVRGIMESGLLYESPFADVNPLGIEGIFAQQGAAEAISIIEDARRRAAA